VTGRHSARAEPAPTDEAPPWVPLAGAAASEDDARATGSPRTVRRVLARFVAGNLVAATLLLAASVWASNAAARNQSLADGKNTTDLLATLLIEPNLQDELLTGDREAVARLDQVVEEQLRDASLVRIKIWDEDERIVYSDEEQLVGRTFPASEYEVSSFDEGDVSAEFTNLAHE